MLWARVLKEEHVFVFILLMLKLEAEEGFSELSEVTASKWQSQAFNPGGLAPESMLLHSELRCWLPSSSCFIKPKDAAGVVSVSVKCFWNYNMVSGDTVSGQWILWVYGASTGFLELNSEIKEK